MKMFRCWSVAATAGRTGSYAYLSGMYKSSPNGMIRSPICVDRRCSQISHRMFSRCLRLDSVVMETHSKLLFSKLSQKQNYKYLDPDIHNSPAAGLERSDPLPKALLQALKSREESLQSKEEISFGDLEKELNTFKDWARNAQLRVGFLLHLNQNIKSKQYLTKVIQMICAEDIENLQSHEFITLLLLIYFRRDITVEEISEHLDLEVLQNKFARLILSNELAAEEIVAGCLGIKKISGCKVSAAQLRASLYRALGMAIQDKQFQDFHLMTLMTTLARGNLVYLDNEATVEQALELFLNFVNDVSLMTAIKLMTFGISCGVEVKELNEAVMKRLDSNMHLLNLKDAMSLANFFSKSPNVNDLVVLSLKGEMLRFFEEAVSVEDMVDVLKTLSFLTANKIYRSEVSVPFLNAFVDILPSEVNKKNLANISETVIRRVTADHKNRDLILADLEVLKSQPKFVNSICNISAQLCFNMRLDEVEVEHMMSMDTAAAILALFYKKLPLQLNSPQMNVQGLENRSRLLVTCYRQVCKILGSERFCHVARILPHFPEPDLVFGSLAGTPMMVPDYLSDPKILRPKRAPTGDWNVLIMANRKNLDADKQIIGIDAVKVRQLKWLGFNPIVVPYTEVNNQKSLQDLLTINRVSMPNLDDGYLDTHKRY